MVFYLSELLAPRIARWSPGQWWCCAGRWHRGRERWRFAGSAEALGAFEVLVEDLGHARFRGLALSAQKATAYTFVVSDFGVVANEGEIRARRNSCRPSKSRSAIVTSSFPPSQRRQSRPACAVSKFLD